MLVLLLGATRVWFFQDIGSEIGNELWRTLCFALAETLFVIRTAGKVVIAQATLALGTGPGPAGALLLTVPPVSPPSLAMLARSFRARLLAVVTAAVVAFSVLGGLLAVGRKL